MVPRKANQRKTIRNRRVFWSKFVLILAVAVMSFVFVFLILKIMRSDNEEQPPVEPEIEVVPEPEPEEPVIEITPINFQPTVDEWVNSIGGRKGVMIYDLDREEVVGKYNADMKFETASLYKLFVVYEGYRRVQNGLLEPNGVINWTGHSALECLDLAIRESYSPCAETLWAIIGRDELDEIVQNDFDITDVIVSNLEATPTEIMQIMKLFYEHPDITNETLIAQIQDSFLNQPTTTYDWRQGLPSGFSENVNVYNKVGWNWNEEYWTIYDDAAILDFVNEDRHFIAVVMTSGVRYQQIRDFGAQIEKAFYDQNVLKN
ncbi:hypothetical protein IKF88_00915 [Candidatus Saccharibacteria bacterium]|nr:hypothetical protein [Candidatus Saccharibacteria bacterium]